MNELLFIGFRNFISFHFLSIKLGVDRKSRGPTQPVKTEEKNREMSGLDLVTGQRVWKFGLHRVDMGGSRW
jgi:hypothetical protein